MKAFRFPLQSVRLLRERREQAAQKKYVGALRAHEEAAAELHLASEELASGWSILCNELNQGASAAALMRSRSWCNVLESRQKECALELQTAQLALDAATREMLVAQRDREAIDRYLDKCRRVHERAVQREDQKQLDELALQHYTPLAMRLLN